MMRSNYRAKPSSRRAQTGRSLRRLALIIAIMTVSMQGRSNPQGLTVQSGTATAVASGATLSINASHNAVLNWQSFNIQSGETTIFHQPSAGSVVWNRINDQNPSQIWGHLQADGVVVLMNRSGFFFGPNATVNAAGFVATTARETPQDLGGGASWQFNGPPPEASIVNYGAIKVGEGGSAYLIASRVENHGVISAPEGSIGLCAGQEVLLSDRPDGRGLSAKVTLPTGSVINAGELIADAGAIALRAQVVNQDGVIQADTIHQHGGEIELVASDGINLGGSSVIEARGDAAGAGNGGDIRLQSGGSFSDSPSSTICVAGGGNGGNGGKVEISALSMPAILSRIDGTARSGRGGQLLIDPTDIILANDGSSGNGSGTIHAGDSPGTLRLNVNSAFVGFSQIDLEATRDIQVAANTTWDLGLSTGISQPGCQLTLAAGRDISLESGASISGPAGWSMALTAGRGIYFRGEEGNPAGIQTQDGSIALTAMNDIILGNGFARTMNGGSIQAKALLGDVDTGTHPNGYIFMAGGLGYMVDPDLGGISTANGGDVTITAGRDIISYMPLPGGVQTDGGSGAFGPNPGNVTLTAGRNVAGHYVVANGVGSITAGANAGTEISSLALSLIDGGWLVNASQNIVLQEVRNPNGIFNNLGLGSSHTRHRFDYGPADWVTLRAGNRVQLEGGDLPRYDDAFEQGIPPIYPSILQIVSGSGGVTLGNDVTLYPSPQGQLEIVTTGGGALTGERPGDLTQLLMSDSGRSQYQHAGDFGLADHAAIPVHINDPGPDPNTDNARLQILVSGDMNNILVGAPCRATITVGANMVNSRFDGQNLRPEDVTRITAVGDILNRNEFTSVTVNAPPDFSVFNNVYPPLSGVLTSLPNLFHYNPTTKTLTFQGRMGGNQLQALLNLQVPVLDGNGNMVRDANGDVETRPANFASASILQQLFASSQDVPLNPDTGYRIGGGGQFIIAAHSMDLGATAGIVSQGPRENYALARYFTHGADINLQLTGDLNMFSTTISSLNGGTVTVTADGQINADSKDFIGNDAFARGIFTAARADVTVIAGGNIDVNGSRIAAYDGGNVTVESLHGNVDAGTGGRGSVAVEEIYVNPVTRRIGTYTPTIPGSGILATTFPASLDPNFPSSKNPVGNITVQTPQGNINASAGGIVQIPMNGVDSSRATVTLSAGSTDPSGHVYVGNIDASGSGVIGSTVQLKATGGVKGLVVARDNIDISAQQNVDVTALGQGAVSVSAGGTVSGTIIGIGSVSAGGATVEATLLSQNVTTSGNAASSQVGFAQGTTANAASQGAQSEESNRALLAAQKSEDEAEEKKKSGTLPRLARNVGRVTVLLNKN